MEAALSRIQYIKDAIVQKEYDITVLRQELKKETHILRNICPHSAFHQIYDYEPCAYGYYYICKTCGINKDDIFNGNQGTVTGI